MFGNPFCVSGDESARENISDCQKDFTVFCTLKGVFKIFNKSQKSERLYII